MSAFAYYSPLWVGAALAVAIFSAVYDTLAPSHRLWVGLLGCPAAGIACQLALIGFQGSFAQVLPVPGGKSIRGRGAMLCGALILLGMGFALAAFLVGYDGLAGVASVATILAGGSLAAALGAYFWCVPAAITDFASSEPKGAGS